MAEPEDVIAEGALLATRVAQELWKRRTAGAKEGPPRLQDLRRRLDFFVAAVFPDAPEIGVAEPPAPPSLLARLAGRYTAHLYSTAAISSTDGDRIRLPASLDGLPASAIIGRYRLLALEQAARAPRGTWEAALVLDPILRDLYLLSEAAAVDAHLVRLFPRLRLSIGEARREALAARPPILRASRLEIAVEALLCTLLTADPVDPPGPFVIAETTGDSQRWAEAQVSALGEATGSYRGLAPVPLWGVIAGSPEAAAATGLRLEDGGTPAGRSRMLPRRPRVREAREDEDDPEVGTWMVRADDLQEKAEDPAGLQRPADRDEQADPGELADALSELPELRLVYAPGAVREVLVGEDPIRHLPGPAAGILTAAIAYPEWDWRAGGYRPRAAIVRELPADNGDEHWVEATLRRYTAMIRAVRRDFERLRPRRTTLTRQTDGADVDVDAVVAAFADRRGGSATDDRFYIDSRPLRRDVAISLLVDSSASTDGWVAGDRRIIDVEKEALLIVVEALAALGDPHAILSFSGEGPTRVETRAVKQFHERASPRELRRRIAGLEPGGYTRAGAALRHATAGLARQPVRHRLLLLLSDGRPNDVDQYEGRYGIEDTRMAVAEARLQGIHVFCLTVDRQAPRYATRIFGRDFAMLSRAEMLPRVLTTLLCELVKA